MNTNSPSLDSSDLIAQLWAGARRVLARLVGKFGAPVDIAARTPMKARERAHLRHWVCAFESFVRKIVLIEAERIGPLPPTRPRLTARTVSAPKPRTRFYSFKLWLRPRPHPARIRSLGEANYSRATAQDRARRDRIERMREANTYGDFRRRSAEERLARRVGALARVLHKPQPYASRLARRLARQPKLALMLATAPPFVSRAFPERSPKRPAQAAAAPPRASTDARMTRADFRAIQLSQRDSRRAPRPSACALSARHSGAGASACATRQMMLPTSSATSSAPV